MDTSKIEKIRMGEIERKLLSMALKYSDNQELQNELLEVIEMIKNEQRRIDAVKGLVSELMTKF